MSHFNNHLCAHRVARSIWSAYMRFGSPKLSIEDELQDTVHESTEQETQPISSSALPMPVETG